MLQKKKWGTSLALFFLSMMFSSVGFGETSFTPALINMENWAPYYRPFEATIQSQTPIQWNNPTASPHTVRHDGCVQEGLCLFDSGAVSPDGSFTIPGLTPGRYPYHCELHPIMRGELIISSQTVGLIKDSKDSEQTVRLNK